MHDKTINLYQAILLLKTPEEVHDFFKDLLTPQELGSIGERWRVCQLLYDAELSYREINRITKASLVTIGRVARFLKTEPYQGYTTILNRRK